MRIFQSDTIVTRYVAVDKIHAAISEPVHV